MCKAVAYCHICNWSGRLFDKDGNVKEWWSSVDAEKFVERAQCFVDQYSNYTVPEVNMNVSLRSLHCIAGFHSC